MQAAADAAQIEAIAFVPQQGERRSRGLDVFIFGGGNGTAQAEIEAPAFSGMERR